MATRLPTCSDTPEIQGRRQSQNLRFKGCDLGHCHFESDAGDDANTWRYHVRFQIPGRERAGWFTEGEMLRFCENARNAGKQETEAEGGGSNNQGYLGCAELLCNYESIFWLLERRMKLVSLLLLLRR